MLEYRNVSIKYQDKYITKNVSFSIEKGHILAIAGESGGGKTTTALSLMGLLPPGFIMEGEVHKDGILWPLKERRKALGIKITSIPQNGAEYLNPSLKVKTQLKDTIQKCGKKNVNEEMIRVLSEAGFDEPESVLDLYPFELSGGMAQRVTLAMSLIQSPDLILADEPTNGMNEADAMGFMNFLKDNFKNSAGILITHDMRVALSSDFILILKEGKVLFYGSADEILKSPDPYVKELLEGGGIHA